MFFDPKLKLEASVQKSHVRSEEAEVRHLNLGQGTAILFNDENTLKDRKVGCEKTVKLVLPGKNHQGC